MRSIAMIFGLLFIALCHPSLSQSTEASSTAAPAAPPTTTTTTTPSPIGDWRDVLFDLHRPFNLSCLPNDGAEVDAGSYSWTVNGTELASVTALAGRYQLVEGGGVLNVTRALEEDWGEYRCAVRGVPARGFRVGAHPVLRLPPNSNVVEGQKLKITCRVIGRPYPAVHWTYAPLGDNETAVDALEHLAGRGSVQPSAAGVEGGELLLDAAQDSDAGNYSCRAPGSTPAYTTLRVKDMYAALWPFLGICAEVFVLCAIILVYEKRRTKPELDDSDTDNHDQKKS